MVDRERRARVGRGQADRAARRRLHREDGHADLVAVRARDRAPGRRRGPTARRAGAAGQRDGDLRHEQRVRALERRGLALQPLGALEAEADPDVVDQALADGQLALRPMPLRSRIPGEP